MKDFFYDLHIHSCLSPCGDNDMTPNNIIGMAKLMGLQILAVSDHNSAKNLPAVCKVGEENGILVVPAMEITTAEEIHVLSFFPDLRTALDFDQEVEKVLPAVQNRPDIFGDQWILNEQDEKVGTVDKLLINALPWSLDKTFDKVRERGGVPVPAHIDKASTSVFSVLGLLPEELHAHTVEAKNPSFEGIPSGSVTLVDSDAHSLEILSAHSPRTLSLPGGSVKEFLSFLKGE